MTTGFSIRPGGDSSSRTSIHGALSGSSSAFVDWTPSCPPPGVGHTHGPVPEWTSGRIFPVSWVGRPTVLLGPPRLPGHAEVPTFRPLSHYSPKCGSLPLFLRSPPSRSSKCLSRSFVCLRSCSPNSLAPHSTNSLRTLQTMLVLSKRFLTAFTKLSFHAHPLQREFAATSATGGPSCSYYSLYLCGVI